MYVHQRDVKKAGFRSLLEGEAVEFDVGAMDDGRLHAIRVTGPLGVDVKGAPHNRDDSDDDEDSKAAASSADKPESSAAAAAAPPAKPKAAMAFVPRVVARPKPAVKPKPKPKPAAAAAAPPAPPST